MAKTSLRVEILFAALLAWSGVAGAQSWLAAPAPPRPFRPGSTALQLTDGTIMVQENSTSNWWKLTPDNHANYSTGTWTQLASSVWLNAQGGSVNYAPRGFASAVLPDGRVIVEGGEFLAGVSGQAETNLGAIFDPTVGPLGAWTPEAAPKGWNKIGDAASIVLPDGTFMLSNCCDYPPQGALLDAKTLTWKVLTSTAGYKNKYDSNNEEGWTLLPNGHVLTVDTYIHAPGGGVPGAPGTLPNHSEVYDPATGSWGSAGDTVEPPSNLQAICNTVGGHEVGPAILRPDGTVFATGVNTCGGAGHTAIYNSVTGTWSKGKDIPCLSPGVGCNDMADAPAAILQDGNVLVETSPGINSNPSRFYEFDFNTNTFSPVIPEPPGFVQSSSEQGRMLAAASGHVFYMRSGALHTSPTSPAMWFYVPQGTYNPVWAPIVTKVTDNGICVGCLDRGQTYTVSGYQLNGRSGGAAYGDDSQSASNYPLVLIENCQTGHKTFARTHDFSTMGVPLGFSQLASAQFTVSPGTRQASANW